MRLDELVRRQCHPLRERDVDEAVGLLAPTFGREHPSCVRDEVVAVAVHCGDAGLTGEPERHSASLCQCSARTPPAVSRMLTPAIVVATGSSRWVTSRDGRNAGSAGKFRAQPVWPRKFWPEQPLPLPMVRGFRNGNIDLNRDENFPSRRERRLIASRADLRETMDQRTG